ncbi:nucleoside hydrolase [Gilvimarinus xylanilyticus]|uniref:Nucleoside hydrolase n=1 Tax=Gilvimarinus xylanilyticus TaxID=2944139 RepID=A0A9X2I630_9GAMM|nr:nucleoside hydrolase [Gilvimarinus xylanilyticus]MCP8900112.1 nucleoside hydrolase [Gilvimarinus xylanilyticus]
MKQWVITFIFALTSTTALATPRIIFDTDFGGDADDLGALAMLNHMHNRGECEFVAVANWNNERYSLPAIAAINQYYGNGEIPLGTRKEGLWHGAWQYNKPLVDALGSPITAQQTPSTTEMYRRLLSKADDNSITIVTVGPLLNILSLLDSSADQYSTLDGKRLVEKKVKEFVVMGGQFPKGEWEWNFNGNMPGVTRKVMEKLDVPVIFSGYEVGQAVKTGESLNQLEKDHPLYIGYRHFSEHAEWMQEQFDGDISANASYDQTAVLYAVRGLQPYWRLSPKGIATVNDEGGNTWEETAEGEHRYLILTDAKAATHAVLSAMLGEDTSLNQTNGE